MPSSLPTIGLKLRLMRGLALFSCVSATLLGWGAEPLVERKLPSRIDLNFHIRPLLSDRCFKCHGSDASARKAGLRLDLEAGAFAALNAAGEKAFVKGDSSRSIAWMRIVSSDPDFQMPPPESNLALTSYEKALISKWIDQGAEWQAHWAFVPPRKPSVPKRSPLPSSPYAETKNAIDYFVQAKQLELGLEASPAAEKVTLIRRLSFDLRGLPPSIQEIDAFLSDESPNAYETLIDRFFSSSAYAERMAMEWLDVARYGDTQGMHGDRERFHWPWRDWVIDAFNRNMAYDDFILWQIAGDLLPGATREQRLATAFHRNHPVSAEGGIIDEEFRVKYVQDRANTTATAFLGLTMECATCHDHKFDPISQKEYYQMSAFFNNLKEIGMVAEGGGSSGPTLLLPGPALERGLKDIAEKIDSTTQRLDHRRAEIASEDELLAAALKEPVPVPVPDAFFPLDSIRSEEIKVKGTIHRVIRNTPIDQLLDDNPSSVVSGEPELVDGRFGKALRLDKEFDLLFLRDVGQFELNQPISIGAWIRTEREGVNQTVMGVSGDLTSQAWRGWDFFLDTSNRLSLRMIGYWPHNYLQVTANPILAKDTWYHVSFTYDGLGKASGVQLYVDGKTAPSRVDYDHLYRTIVHPWGEQEGWPQKPLMVGRSGRFYTGDNGVFTGSIDHIQLFNQSLSAREVAAWHSHDTGESIDPGPWTSVDVLDHYLIRKDPLYQEQILELRNLLGQKLKTVKEVKEIMVMEEKPVVRKTFVLNRGQYDAPTVEVQPGTPTQILPFPDDLPRNRLGLSRWLTHQANPLTARVTVNRYWQMIFGRGIVASPQDFGSQGALPTHPQLLDWLAVFFVESGWDVRALLRAMVTSATYRQSSVASQQHLEQDPNNRFLARGPSYRLPAEMIRDNALAASGLLTLRVGGRSVKPYQPEGLWIEKTGPGNSYQHDSGENLYRRGLYTYIRRTTPHPAMIAFDAPNRSGCIVKRELTNTPLQALVLLNDPQFVEAARVLAQTVQLEGRDRPEDQIQYGFRRVCGRAPSSKEAALLLEQYETALNRFSGDAAAIDAILGVGEAPIDSRLEGEKTAALTIVVNTVMNFDDAYTKR
jgi:hypothetical protein